MANVRDDDFNILNAADASKVIDFDLSPLTSGTAFNRTISAVDYPGVWVLADAENVSGLTKILFNYGSGTLAPTWGAPDFPDDIFRISSAGDSSKKLVFNVGGISSSPATWTLLDASGYVALCSAVPTAGRVPFAGSSGVFTDDADFTFATDTLTVTKLVVGGGASVAKLDHGTYTPTLTNAANVSASTAYQCQYMRVGSIVTVSGKVDVDPTSPNTPTQLGISLPIASNLGSEQDCAGSAGNPNITTADGGCIRGDATNDRAELAFTIGTDTANNPWFFIFMYEVI